MHSGKGSKKRCMRMMHRPLMLSASLRLRMSSTGELWCRCPRPTVGRRVRGAGRELRFGSAQPSPGASVLLFSAAAQDRTRLLLCHPHHGPPLPHRTLCHPDRNPLNSLHSIDSMAYHMLPPVIDLTDDDDLIPPSPASPPSTFKLFSPLATPSSTPPRPSGKRKPSAVLAAPPSQRRYSLRSHYFPLPASHSPPSFAPPSDPPFISPSLLPPVDLHQLTPSDLFLFPSTSSITSSLHTPSTCHISFISHFLSPLCIRLLHAELSTITTWQTGQLHGNPIPRVSCWCASEPYKYAGKNWPHFPHPPSSDTSSRS